MMRPYSVDPRERVVAEVKAVGSALSVLKTFRVGEASVVKRSQ
jgi:hypothetical protein